MKFVTDSLVNNLKSTVFKTQHHILPAPDMVTSVWSREIVYMRAYSSQQNLNNMLVRSL